MTHRLAVGILVSAHDCVVVLQLMLFSARLIDRNRTCQNEA